MRICLLVFLMTLVTACSSSKKKSVPEITFKEQCLSTREFVTTLEYLKNTKTIGTKERRAGEGIKGRSRRLYRIGTEVY
jgi:hypothetical protein